MRRPVIGKARLAIVVRWFFLILAFHLIPSTGHAVCDPCTAPKFGEWKYQANDCSNYIPSSYGFMGDEAGFVEAVKDAMAYCNSGFNETPWVDLEYPDAVYLGGVCGGGGYYPQYSSSFHLEDHNYRTIGTIIQCHGYGLHRIRDIFCPPGTYIQDGLCKAQAGAPIEDKNLGLPACNKGDAGTAGDPLNVAFANKVQVETDLAPSSLSGLGITRTYNSQDVRTTRSYRFGKGWHSGQDHAIRLVNAAVDTVYLTRPDAKTWYFTLRNGLWEADADVPGTLTTTPGGWQYLNAQDEVEDYDTEGRLTRITKPSGITFDYTYTPSNVIDTVTTSLGESLSYTYDAGRRIESITDHTGRVWKYQYDANGNLEYVLYPDGTPLDDTDNPLRQYHYEDPAYPNALTGITDERGVRYANFEYDANGQPTASYLGPQTGILTERIDGVTVAYNGAERTVTNSKGVPSTYTIANQIGVALVTDLVGPGCASCGSGNSTYNYDPATNDLLTKTENGHTTEYGAYDANGNAGYRIEALGTAEERLTDYTYDPRYFGRIATKTEPSVYPGASKVTSYGYDDFGNRTSETVSGFAPDGTPVSRATTWAYNGPLHQLSQVDGPLPNTPFADITTYDYYPDDPGEAYNRARLKRVTGPVYVERDNMTYTATGKVASEDRPNGLQLTYTYYPGNDRLETLSESDGTTTRFTRWTYLPTGEVERIITADGTPDATTLTFAYDDARRLTRITDGLGNYIEYTLDTEGNRVGEDTYDSGALLRKALTRTFDLYSRLDTTSQANESLDDDYAPDGTLDQQTDGEGTVTDYGYDALKRLVSSTQDLGGLGALTQYDYDVADRLTSVTDPVNGNTTYQYDDLGNRLQTTSPDTGTTVSTYDAAGNLKSRTDALGQLFLYSYDALNRLTGVDAPGTDDDIIYGYDTCPNGTGRLCSVIPPTATLTYAYDAFGNVTAHQGIAYSHDAANRLKTLTYPSGAVVTYSYDAAGQVSQVDLTEGGTTTTLASGISYAPFGAVESLGYGNGATLSQGLDSAYRLTSQSIPGVLALGYTAYDGNGNLETRTDPDTADANFVYDPLNRLDTASGAFGSRDYDYDLNGNRSTLVSDGATTSYGYTPDSNRLATETGWTYTLDANGNTTQRLDVDGAGRLYAYNPHNRLVSATGRSVIPGHGPKPPTITDTLLGEYAYNGLGQRLSKVVDGVTTQYRYGTDGALLAELDGSGTVLKEYVYLNGQLLAVLDITTTQGGSSETIVDNGEAGTTSTGSWTVKTGNQDYGIDYLLADDPGTPSTYRWTPTLPAGTYEVYAWWVSKGNYSNNVPYTIGHNGQTDTVYRDQSGNGGSWQLLGTFSFDGSGTEYVEVSNANGKTTADAVRFVDVGGSGGTEAAVYYVHNDHLGTPQAMTDEAGSVVWRATYDPFGDASVDEDPDGDGTMVTLNVRFPGQYYDQETGLHYNYYRYYDPEVGRYLTTDPRGQLLDFSDPTRQVAATMGIDIPRRNKFGYLNHIYGYVDSNPVNRADPTGEIDPVTAGLIIWGLLYINNAGDAISDTNGNLWGEPQDQDNVCTLPFPIGPIADQCVLDRCQRHDACYDENECTASSWIPSLLGGTKPCNQCNSGFFK